MRDTDRLTKAPADDQVATFLDGLRDEKRYFDFDRDKIMGACVKVGIADGHGLAGLCGYYRMYGIPTFFIVVRRDRQGQGIGKRLMENLWGETVGGLPRLLILTVHKDNTRAIRLYEKQGFTGLGDILCIRYMGRARGWPGRLAVAGLKTLFPLIRVVRKRKHEIWLEDGPHG